MILSTSITAHPGAGRDLVPQARDPLEEIPAFAGKSGPEIRPPLALTSKAQAQQLPASAGKQLRA